MASTKKPSDAQIFAQLRRAKGGRTAAQLKTTSARLRALPGVVEVGRVVKKVHGKAVAGRPAVLFDLEENASISGSNEESGRDPSAESRDGSLNETPVL